MNDKSSPKSQTLTDVAVRIPKVRISLNSSQILEVKNARLYR